MATGRIGQAADQARGEAASGRAVNLQGDSPELVAFALLRYLAQLEQARERETGVVFDRDWLLAAYSDCLDAVKGNRTTAPSTPSKAAATAARGSRSRR
jgi:hypothetical protein